MRGSANLLTTCFNLYVLSTYWLAAALPHLATTEAETVEEHDLRVAMFIGLSVSTTVHPALFTGIEWAPVFSVAAT